MLILTIRTDKPEAEVGLFDGLDMLAYESWHAHRELSMTLHRKIEAILRAKGKNYSDLQGIVGFAGPGSFTGLRIGLTVANAFAYGLRIPVFAAQHENWVQDGIQKLATGEDGKMALPEYGAPAHITVQRK